MVQISIEPMVNAIHDADEFNKYYTGDDKRELIQDNDIFNIIISSAGTCGVIYSIYLKVIWMHIF